MNLATLEPSQENAREKYYEYLQAVRLKRTKEREAIKNAYRELSRGKVVIDIRETLRRGGVDDRKRPRLAIIRADAQLCYFRTNYTREVMAFSMDRSFWFARRKSTRELCFSTAILGGVSEITDRLLRAVVPGIPPRHHPGSEQLCKLHILWEADWEEYPIDPALLRHLGGPFYLVLAVWDLTAVERAALSAASEEA